MKSKFFILGLLMIHLTISAQVDRQKQIEREKAKVTIFTSTERANLELWFYNQTKKMGLTEEMNTEYERIFYDRIYDMSRLNDRDKNLSDDELHRAFDGLVDQMNAEIKQILTKDQYIQHLENFGEIIRSIYRKMNWNE